jgi:hypothetical protein
MKRVYKYPLVYGKDDVVQARLTLPKGAKILKLDMQNRSETVWAVVDPGAEQETYLVEIFATGQDLPEDIDSHTYLGTLLTRDDFFVWHYFMRTIDA